MSIFKVVNCAKLILNLAFNVPKLGASNDNRSVKK